MAQLNEFPLSIEKFNVRLEGGEPMIGDAVEKKTESREEERRLLPGSNALYGSRTVSNEQELLYQCPGVVLNEYGFPRFRERTRFVVFQYHPDVCRGSKCGVQFHQINQAYDVVMSNLRGESNEMEMEMYEACDDDAGIDEAMRGMNDPDWDLWEEWMGWQGAGIRDYSSHINPYI
nr:uncharacterized protein LOC112748700 [Arachis hypogaea]